jgi:hypothetical protein
MGSARTVSDMARHPTGTRATIDGARSRRTTCAPHQGAFRRQAMHHHTRQHPIATTENHMTRRSTTPALEDHAMPIQAKLAAAWASFMFLAVYVDIFNFFKPGVVEDILAGVVWRLQITQTFLVVGLALMAVPILMVMASMILPARVNRMANLVVASLYVPITAMNILDESWTIFYGMGIALGLGVIAVIIRVAWAWPRGLPAHDESSTAASGSQPVVRPRTSSAPT